MGVHLEKERPELPALPEECASIDDGDLGPRRERLHQLIRRSRADGIEPIGELFRIDAALVGSDDKDEQGALRLSLPPIAVEPIENGLDLGCLEGTQPEILLDLLPAAKEEPAPLPDD